MISLRYVRGLRLFALLLVPLLSPGLEAGPRDLGPAEEAPSVNDWITEASALGPVRQDLESRAEAASRGEGDEDFLKSAMEASYRVAQVAGRGARVFLAARAAHPDLDVPPDLLDRYWVAMGRWEALRSVALAVLDRKEDETPPAALAEAKKTGVWTLHASFEAGVDAIDAVMLALGKLETAGVVF